MSISRILATSFQWAASSAALCLLAQCGSPSQQVVDDKSPMADTLTLALDWSPNVLHAGIFLAEHEGWYAAAGLYLDWFTTEVDNYEKKPVQRLVDGGVDLAIAPSEHLFYFRESGRDRQPMAIATLLHQGLSSFCLKAQEGVSSPADLEGYTYVGYHTPLEKAIIETMVAHSGGGFELEMTTPGRLQVWERFMENDRQLAWIFKHWEGILAEEAGVDLTCFDPQDHGVPYGYSSVVMAMHPLSREKESAFRVFLEVTERGYRRAATMAPDSLASILYEAVPHPNFENSVRVEKALKTIVGAYLGKGDAWGQMQAEVWESYLNWIGTAVHEEDPIHLHPAAAYFTNQYLE